MQVEMILETIKKAGGKLAVIDGGLKAKTLNDSTRRLVKNHKAEIVQFLLKPPVELNLKLCPLCNGREFIHGNQGGYFCRICQPDVRPGTPIRAGGERPVVADQKMEKR